MSDDRGKKFKEFCKSIDENQCNYFWEGVEVTWDYLKKQTKEFINQASEVLDENTKLISANAHLLSELDTARESARARRDKLRTIQMVIRKQDYKIKAYEEQLETYGELIALAKRPLESNPQEYYSEFSEIFLQRLKVMEKTQNEQLT